MREVSSTDFFVDVDGIGRFSFARRAPKDVYRARALCNGLTDGYADQEGNLDMGAFMFATLKTLMVSAPAGFDLDKLDPVLDDDWEDKVIAIFKALRAMELSFRPEQVATMQGKSAPPINDVSVEVQAPVQPAAN